MGGYSPGDDIDAKGEEGGEVGKGAGGTMPRPAGKLSRITVTCSAGTCLLPIRSPGIGMMSAGGVCVSFSSRLPQFGQNAA